jgi:putative transposase
MLRLLRLLFELAARSVCSRRDLLLENLALRQQLGALKQRHPQPRLAAPDRLFWVVALAGMETFAGPRPTRDRRPLASHRVQVVLDVTLAASDPVGRRCVNKELRELIFRMVSENPMWGAPRIYGELKMLSFNISERTVLRWMRKAPRDPEPPERSLLA